MATATVYWQAFAMSADGQVTQEDFGNGVTTARYFDSATGLVQSIDTWTASDAPSTPTGQRLGYVFDAIGNLRQREDVQRGLSEAFLYDGHNRLISAQVGALPALTMTYDLAGNILTKSDVAGGAYTYGPGKTFAGSSAAGPHAVVAAGGNSYAYDANGNLLSVTDAQSNVTRTLEWTSFNKPSYIRAGPPGTADGSRFFHGPDRARVIQSRIDGAYARTQVHVGGLFEHVTDTNPGRPAENVHYIAAAGGTVAIHKVRLDANPATDELLYVHRDHLGSVDTLTDASGEVKESLAFGPWGARRDAADWDGPATFAAPPPGIVPLGDAPDTTPRGFTGHEHLDNVALVHMNGRIYDPVIGRFLSADPFVQAPGSTQAFNRYTYVNNNPLSYTDPSGFFFKKLFRAVKKIFKNKVVRTAIAIGVSFIPGAQTLGVALLKGFAVGFVGSGGDLKAGLLGAVTAGAFHGVGTYFDGLAIANGSGFDAGTPFLSGGQQFAKVVAHGAVGGAASKVSGGSFQDGFLGAGVAQFGAGAIGAIQGPSIIRVVAAAAVGGTASALGGGKFANGAVTAAFGYLFNEMQHSYAERTVFPGRHSYVHLSDVGCLEGSPRCSFGSVVSAVHHLGAYPGQADPLIVDGGYQYRELDSLYGDPFTTDPIYSLPTSSGVVNVTTPDHALHPGYVIRDVVRTGKFLRIRTIGGGWGKYGKLNNDAASELWGDVNRQVFGSLR